MLSLRAYFRAMPSCLEILPKLIPILSTSSSQNTPRRPFAAAPPLRPPASLLRRSGTLPRFPSPSYSARGLVVERGMGEDEVSFLTQRQAAEIDELLMGPLGFSVDQLMELAGLSVAASIYEVYKPSEYNRVLVVCGPGNNGGDGLVAARHLYHFGYKPFMCYPKRTPKTLYTGLVTQLESLSVPFLPVEDLPQNLADDFDLVVDAMFGFSFQGDGRKDMLGFCHNAFTDALRNNKHYHPVRFEANDGIGLCWSWTLWSGQGSYSFAFAANKLVPEKLDTLHKYYLPSGKPRPPFDDIIRRLVSLANFDSASRSLAIVSVDIPSGWHVEEGDMDGDGIKPEMLVSLTAPKLCAKKFLGPHHFLGGRFVPPPIAEKFGVHLPSYPGASMCVRIGKPPSVDISALRENYISSKLLEEEVMADPIDQFLKWFDEAVASSLREPNAMALSTSGKEGKPSSRMVLLKGVDKEGFVWYTNYESRKARELAENPCASLLFFWNELERQVRVEGTVQKVPMEESEKYFHSRPRGSQLGAIVSEQSTVVAGRHVLYQTYKELEDKYSDGSLIPKPDYWGGYRLKPTLIEFWQGQPSRLHDRLQYSLREVNGMQVWHIERLAP